MDNDWIITLMILDDLGSMGYKEVWIGCSDNPHWPGSWGITMVVASPKRKKFGWPALWTLNEKYGGHGSGNGLKNADNLFVSWAVNPLSGHYVRSEGSWEKH
jgi:hypothetical protein